MDFTVFAIGAAVIVSVLLGAIIFIMVTVFRGR